MDKDSPLGDFKVVVFCGERQSGKSTAANAIRRRTNWKKLSFADPLYRMMSEAMCEDARTADKEEPRKELGGKTLREALQTLGTEWGREMVYKDIWLDHMVRRITLAKMGGAPGVVIDDCRFRNEYDALQQFNPTVVRVVRPGLNNPETTHASEKDWQSFPVDREIVNDYSSEEEFAKSLFAPWM